MLKKFEKNYLSNLEYVDFSEEGMRKEKIKQYNFFTQNSSEITYELLTHAESLINRTDGWLEIDKYLNNEYLSISVEKGLFESTLLTVINKKYPTHYCEFIYKSSLYDICNNLDLKNEDIDNQTLYYSIINKEIDPLIIAFLSPQQMHPKRWEIINQKKAREDDAMYNIETTDEFTCSGCGESKSTVDYIQLRSADEPATKFVTCVVCHKTVIH
jgi:DNA-directed RNA polymerase subunit M/transcription elongation factor TFIIS